MQAALEKELAETESKEQQTGDDKEMAGAEDVKVKEDEDDDDVSEAGSEDLEAESSDDDDDEEDEEGEGDEDVEMGEEKPAESNGDPPKPVQSEVMVH